MDELTILRDQLEVLVEAQRSYRAQMKKPIPNRLYDSYNEKTVEIATEIRKLLYRINILERLED